GGLTGLFLGALATDIHLHDTYFVVAHFHYVMVGGTLMALLGGLYHWWPKMFGRMYNETWGKIGAVLVFAGFNFTFFPQFVIGARGMPRRYFNYLPEFQTGHIASTYGAYLLGFGILFAFAGLAWSAFKGPKAAANPWGANTLEWKCSSPPPYYNFENPPEVDEPYDYRGKSFDEKTGGYVDAPSA
ncbi:MAG: cbb3-type cytochrome c oxidase subunit I, partial [Myxococcota bacterium]